MSWWVFKKGGGGGVGVGFMLGLDIGCEGWLEGLLVGWRVEAGGGNGGEVKGAWWRLWEGAGRVVGAGGKDGMGAGGWA